MKKDKDFTGFPGDCNETQIATLQEFRDYITKNFPTPHFDDSTLLRFLRARKFDLAKTILMFSAHMDWYKQMEVAQIGVNENQLIKKNFKSYLFTELPQVRNFYPHGYHKTDKLGRPIYIERIGLLDLTKLFQVTNEDRLIKYYIQSYETLLNRILPGCSQAHGSRVDQTFTILDLKNCSMKMMSKQVYNFIQLASKVGQDHYPEILGKMFIINAPMLFSGVWAMIKIWLDEKTRAKITIIGSSYKEELLKYIDISNLPDFLGGNSKSPSPDIDILSLNEGPWNPEGKYPLFCGEPNYVEYPPVHDAGHQLECDLKQLNINQNAIEVSIPYKQNENGQQQQVQN